MSIHRSGLNSVTIVICVTDIELNGLILKSGEKYELIHDLVSMYVLIIKGNEVIAPKDIFKVV